MDIFFGSDILEGGTLFLKSALEFLIRPELCSGVMMCWCTYNSNRCLYSISPYQLKYWNSLLNVLLNYTSCCHIEPSCCIFKFLKTSNYFHSYGLSNISTRRLLILHNIIFLPLFAHFLTTYVVIFWLLSTKAYVAVIVFLWWQNKNILTEVFKFHILINSKISVK